MLPNWENRPKITAYLINPAFCSEIMRECITAYKNESNSNFPFALSVLILPLILNSRIRMRLPRTKSSTIHKWINENEDLKIGLPQNITSFLPFTKEAIMFAIANNSLNVDANGEINLIQRKKKLNAVDEEIKHCIKKAETLGKILSKSGNPTTIYSILGIKP